MCGTVLQQTRIPIFTHSIIEKMPGTASVKRMAAASALLLCVVNKKQA